MILDFVLQVKEAAGELNAKIIVVGDDIDKSCIDFQQIVKHSGYEQ